MCQVRSQAGVFIKCHFASILPNEVITDEPSKLEHIPHLCFGPKPTLRYDLVTCAMSFKPDSLEGEWTLMIAASVETRRGIIISPFQQKTRPAPYIAPADPWQLLISVCPSSLRSSQLLRPLGPLQINYKRLGNHSNSIWPRAPGLVFHPAPVCLSVGQRVQARTSQAFENGKFISIINI